MCSHDALETAVCGKCLGSEVRGDAAAAGRLLVQEKPPAGLSLDNIVMPAVSSSCVSVNKQKFIKYRFDCWFYFIPV